MQSCWAKFCGAPEDAPIATAFGRRFRASTTSISGSNRPSLLTRPAPRAWTPCTTPGSRAVISDPSTPGTGGPIETLVAFPQGPVRARRRLLEPDGGDLHRVGLAAEPEPQGGISQQGD